MASRRIPAASVDAGHDDDLAHAGEARRLTTTVLGGSGLPVSHPPVAQRLASDSELARHVEQLVAEAFEAGRAEGRREGADEQAARLEHLAQAVTLTVTDVEERIEEARQAAVGGMLDLAVAIAEVVIGRTPHDDGAAVLRRVEEALEHLDERPLTLMVSPVDETAARTAADAIEDLAVEVDGSLAPGEARLRGGWSSADLTHGAAWEAVRRQLNGG